MVILIRATNYDDRGYPRRFHFGVLPSNSLAALNSLTIQALDEIIRDKSLPIEYSLIKVFDDSVWSQRVSDPEKLVRRYQDGHTLVVVGLVGVQTNQFPRARDLAVRFQKAGAQVVIGGFHVSGSIAALYDGIGAGDPSRQDIPCPHIMPPEIQQLMDGGVIVCCGESENSWRVILKDIILKRHKSFYHGDYPDLTDAPLPQYPPNYFRRFATPISTLDFSRGCPFKCKFCTVINVQGRTLRTRDPRAILDKIRKICEQNGSIKLFVTDDNFARNPHWEEILDGLIILRREGYNISFICQVDSASYFLPEFLEKLRDAGCSQAFCGIESVNPLNLEQAGKRQNKIDEYRALCDALHQHGIIAHAGYIIGFKADTRESILRDVQTLKEMGFDQVSFFIWTILPGSEDYARAVAAGTVMDNDFNKFDSAHAMVEHPNMTKAELEKTLRLCYKEFYRSRHMINVLRRLPKQSFWGMLLGFLWYRNSMLGELAHPMVCGFGSACSRGEMRPGNPKESLPAFWLRKSWFKLRYAGCLLREFYIFQYVYFESTKKPDTGKIADRRESWFKKTFRLEPSRQWLNDFWIKYGRQKWSLLWKPQWHWRMIPHAITEIVYSWKFWRILKAGKNKMTK